MQKNDLLFYLVKLGLTATEAEIYVALLTHGASTPLSLSRITQVNRTKVYRILGLLQQRRLVAQEVEEHTTHYSPAPLIRIQELLKEKQARVRELARDYSQVETSLEALSAKASSDTKVKFYRGKEGIRQMVWNVLKAKQEIVGYTFRDLADFVGETFMDQFVAEFKRRNLSMRDIYGDEYGENQHTDYDWGKRIRSRYLPREILAIPHQMDIYDDVVSFYSWNAGEVWGTEIYNITVAQMQKQLFELAWENATKVT